MPSFTATQSALQPPNRFKKTAESIAPILPHKATDIDSIYTVMVNFQDVLKQKKQPCACGALWCDEGVYQVAKEIQLQKPDQFDNII